MVSKQKIMTIILFFYLDLIQCVFVWGGDAKMYLKYIYFMLSMLKMCLHIYVLNKKYPAIVLLVY